MVEINFYLSAHAMITRILITILSQPTVGNMNIGHKLMSSYKIYISSKHPYFLGLSRFNFYVNYINLNVNDNLLYSSCCYNLIVQKFNACWHIFMYISLMLRNNSCPAFFVVEFLMEMLMRVIHNVKYRCCRALLFMHLPSSEVW